MQIGDNDVQRGDDLILITRYDRVTTNRPQVFIEYIDKRNCGAVLRLSLYRIDPRIALRAEMFRSRSISFIPAAPL